MLDVSSEESPINGVLGVEVVVVVVLVMKCWVIVTGTIIGKKKNRFR